MTTATIIQKNYVNMLPNNKVMLKNKTKFVLVKAAFPALRVSVYSTSVRWLHQKNLFFNIYTTSPKIGIFSEFLLHYTPLCSSQFFQNNFSTCFILFFWLIKLNLS